MTGVKLCPMRVLMQFTEPLGMRAQVLESKEKQEPVRQTPAFPPGFE